MDEFEQPDVLVLGGGGILGEAWMSSLLAGLAEASGFDPHGCAAYLGTSAASIVAAALTAGVDRRSPHDELPDRREPPDEAVAAEAPRPLARVLAQAGKVAGPLAALSLPYVSPGGALLRRKALGRVTPGRRSLAVLGAAVDQWDLGWDGRLRISAVDMDSGRRVMFGEEGAPEASVADAVEASCAIPGFFRPIEIAGPRYVDGGVWSCNGTVCTPQGDDARPTVVCRKLARKLGTVTRFAIAQSELGAADLAICNQDQK